MYNKLSYIMVLLIIVHICSSCTPTVASPAENAMPRVEGCAVLDLRNESESDIENAVIVVNHAAYDKLDERLEFPLPFIKTNERIIFIIDVSFISYKEPYSYSNVRIEYQQKQTQIIDEWRSGLGASGIISILGESKNFTIETIDTSYRWRSDSDLSYPKPYDLLYAWYGEAFVLQE